MGLRRRATLLFLASAALLLSPSARADGGTAEKAVCARSAEAAQALRAEGKLVRAREVLLACVKESCPQVVRQDCATWLGDVDASMPSVVFVAQDASGKDLPDVKVTLDGAPLGQARFGRAVPVDPGAHDVRFERPGRLPFEERVVVAAGEKNRRVVATFASETEGSASAGTPISPSPPALAWVFAALTVTAGASFAYFGATGQSDLNHLRATCAGHCAEADVDSAWTKLTVADVSLAVGIASLGVATWLFLKPRASVFVAPTAHGASLGFGARF